MASAMLVEQYLLALIGVVNHTLLRRSTHTTSANQWHQVSSTHLTSPETSRYVFLPTLTPDLPHPHTFAAVGTIPAGVAVAGPIDWITVISRPTHRGTGLIAVRRAVVPLWADDHSWHVQRGQCERAVCPNSINTHHLSYPCPCLSLSYSYHCRG